jgi:hypothetical protein
VGAARKVWRGVWRSGGRPVLDSRSSLRVTCGLSETLQKSVLEIMVVYVREMGVLGAARKEARRTGSPKPIGAACDLWVALDTSEIRTRA